MTANENITAMVVVAKPDVRITLRILTALDHVEW
jgi:hypothetical protein